MKKIICFVASIAALKLIAAAIHQASHRITLGGEMFVPLLMFMLYALWWQEKGIWKCGGDNGKGTKSKPTVGQAIKPVQR